MQRKYQIAKELADVVQNKIQEGNHPINIYFGKEEVDCHGSYDLAL